MGTKLPSLLSDKDKLILVINVYIKNMNRDKGIALLNNMNEYFVNKFDDTVKVLIMPVLCEEQQGIEVLNPIFANEKTLERINSNYEEILNIFNEKNSL